ncbi:membrane protein, partial [mine drainage metagenome]
GDSGAVRRGRTGDGRAARGGAGDRDGDGAVDPRPADRGGPRPCRDDPRGGGGARMGAPPRRMTGRSGLALASAVLAVALLAGPFPGALAPAHPPSTGTTRFVAATASAVANFTASLNRLVELLGLGGGAILSLVWARVAFSWFSNDVTKKVQAKDRARDALIGTLLFTAAVSGFVWGLA